MKVTRKGGNIAKIAREALEKEIGKSAVTSSNRLNYEYLEKNEILIENKKINKEIKQDKNV